MADAHDEPVDLWAVRVDGLWLGDDVEPDEPAPPEEAFGRRAAYRIVPERLSLAERDVAPSPAPPARPPSAPAPRRPPRGLLVAVLALVLAAGASPVTLPLLAGAAWWEWAARIGAGLVCGLLGLAAAALVATGVRMRLGERSRRAAGAPARRLPTWPALAVLAIFASGMLVCAHGHLTYAPPRAVFGPPGPPPPIPPPVEDPWQGVPEAQFAVSINESDRPARLVATHDGSVPRRFLTS